MSVLHFKKIIIIFWFLWWLIALWTDVVGGLAHMGWLHASWAPDTNLPFLIESLKMYQPPLWLIGIFFAGILLGLFLSTVSFLWAVLGLNQPTYVWMVRAKTAFIISITLWLAFFLADQMIMKFDLEENHMVQGGFQLLTFLALYWLPNE